MPRKKIEGAEKDRRREFGSIVERGASFVARWTEPNGRRRDKRFPTRSLAQRHLDLKAQEFLRAEVLGVSPVESVTFDSLLDRYENLFRSLKSPSVIRREIAFLRAKALPFFKGRSVETIGRSDVERFLSIRAEKDKAGPATRNRTASMLSALFKRAIRLGHARENPCAGIERSREETREPVYLSLEAQERVIAECPLPLRWAVTVLLDSGLRTGELLRLAWADFDPARGSLTVRQSKNGHPRSVSLTSRGRAALEAHRSAVPEGGRPADRIFREFVAFQSSGEPRFSWPAMREWRKARIRAKVPSLRIHDLRHSFAATAVRAGVPLSDLQRLLGHKSMTMTLRYGGHSPANAADLARERMEALFRSSPVAAEAQ